MSNYRLLSFIACSLLVIAMIGCSDKEATLFDTTPESTTLAAQEQIQETFVLTVEKNGVITETKELTPRQWRGADQYEMGQLYTFPSKSAYRQALIELGKPAEIINVLTQGSETKLKDSNSSTNLSSWPSYSASTSQQIGWKAYGHPPLVEIGCWEFSSRGTCQTVDDPSQSNTRRTAHAVTFTSPAGYYYHWEGECWSRENPTNTIGRGVLSFPGYSTYEGFSQSLEGRDVLAIAYEWYPYPGFWAEKAYSYRVWEY